MAPRKPATSARRSFRARRPPAWFQQGNPEEPATSRDQENSHDNSQADCTDSGEASASHHSDEAGSSDNDSDGGNSTADNHSGSDGNASSDKGTRYSLNTSPERSGISKSSKRKSRSRQRHSKGQRHGSKSKSRPSRRGQQSSSSDVSPSPERRHRTKRPRPDSTSTESSDSDSSSSGRCERRRCTRRKCHRRRQSTDSDSSTSSSDSDDLRHKRLKRETRRQREKGPVPTQGLDDQLGTGVKRRLKTRIRAHKYVNLCRLLPTYSSKSKKKEIFEIDRWTEAFFIFASIYLKRYPTEGRSLLKYMALIRQIAQRGRHLGWKQYDEQFRKKRERKHTPWHQTNWLLLWEHGGVSQYGGISHEQQSGRNPSNSFQSGRLPTQRPQPQAQQWTSTVHDPEPLPTGYCYAFHGSSTCPYGEQCRYYHTCPDCDGHHRRILCTRQAHKQPSQTKQPSKPNLPHKSDPNPSKSK